MTTCLIVISGGTIEFILQGDQGEEAREKLKITGCDIYIAIIQIFRSRVFIHLWQISKCSNLFTIYKTIFRSDFLSEYKFVQSTYSVEICDARDEKCTCGI